MDSLFSRPNVGERALLIFVSLKDAPHSQDDIDEFQELAISAGAKIIDIVTQAREKFEAKYLLGAGKVDELKKRIKSENIELIIVNHELSPAQERNLEKELECRVIDRTGLILDIFAQRARTFEGKLQVERALLQYISTRLIRGWTHLERQKGGIGLRGPGETQLELDRRAIRVKIKNIDDRLANIIKQREQSRRSRKKALYPTISLIGYTNAGKSTLFNRLTNSDIYVANKLFATLDTTLRVRNIPAVGKVVFSDTVGFIKDLPHDLVDAFKATLEETQQADILLHVIDASDHQWQDKINAVNSVLKEIHADKIPTILVFNKIDKLQFPKEPGIDRKGLTPKVWVSAVKNLGIEELITCVQEELSIDMISGCLKITPLQQNIRNKFYEIGGVICEESENDGTMLMEILLPLVRWEQICHEYPELKHQFSETRKNL